ncbi:hypothetical protein AAD001_08105 [Colwelliaceae bacterium 6471]
MKTLPQLFTLILIFALSACSSTKTVKLDDKPVTSDLQLAHSLLNRPMTADHIMMIAFANTREEYARENNLPFEYVSIRGNKFDDAITERPAQDLLVINDTHAISLLGPR